jgi:hypothetical protein
VPCFSLSSLSLSLLYNSFSKVCFVCCDMTCVLPVGVG